MHANIYNTTFKNVIFDFLDILVPNKLGIKMNMASDYQVINRLGNDKQGWESSLST